MTGSGQEGYNQKGAMQEAMEYPENLDPICLFCRWIRAEKAVKTFGTVAAFHDGNPVTDGHLLIVPLRHTADWLSMTPQEVRDSEMLIRHLVEKIRRKDPSVTGFNIGVNIGVSAGQTVFHAHIHLIPRRDGDTENPKGGVRGVVDGKRAY
ncbi:HIT family protein [uncultured Desulfosarcina sp.]|uniref:HIT family protein n=1 Tax=uncultured Desulfosarcina sp. TaxID=218289 RepID=UPI0029C6E402|nr:HIT family protein [uncultured Desulfosarcina sp.]